MVYRWEEELAVPSRENVARLASIEIFGVSIDEIDPDGKAWTTESPRKRQRVDNPAEVGKIPYSPQQPPTTTEGLMSDQVRRLEGALLLLPEQHRESFIHEINVRAARRLLELEEPSAMLGKRARASGKG
jgi:hypothetical protein